ncbi:MAG: glycoside hydrolase family 3 N-terminal domain-containing protein [Limisphaerales bacterium]
MNPPVREGKAMGIMAAYHDIDGVPCTGNPWLLNKVLRDEWGFQGFVLADLGAIRRLYDTHHVADSPTNAVLLALNSAWTCSSTISITRFSKRAHQRSKKRPDL